MCILSVIVGKKNLIATLPKLLESIDPLIAYSIAHTILLAPANLVGQKVLKSLAQQVLFPVSPRSLEVRIEPIHHIVDEVPIEERDPELEAVS
jgi:hypothetical protein